MSICFRAPLRAHVFSLATVAALIISMAGQAEAHVTLDSPNGGELLSTGETTVIQWRPTPEHDTIGWALWYSTASNSGPWVLISDDLPLGDISTDSIHLYEWTVPSLSDESVGNDVWVRVLQENDVEQDYYDVSDASFAIASAAAAGDYNADGVVNAADYVVWADSAGPSGDAAGYAAWGDAFRGAQPAAPRTVEVTAEVTAVPEPSVSLLAGVLAAVVLACRRTRVDQSSPGVATTIALPLLAGWIRTQRTE